MGLFQAHHLTKIYRRRKVVNDVTFHVDPGEIVGLLGPNGAGKTTVFKMAMGMVRPDGGSVELGGTDEGEPGPRGGDAFYAGYFRDLDGNKLNFFHMSHGE